MHVLHKRNVLESTNETNDRWWNANVLANFYKSSRSLLLEKISGVISRRCHQEGKKFHQGLKNLRCIYLGEWMRTFYLINRNERERIIAKPYKRYIFFFFSKRVIYLRQQRHSGMCRNFGSWWKNGAVWGRAATRPFFYFFLFRSYESSGCCFLSLLQTEQTHFYLVNNRSELKSELIELRDTRSSGTTLSLSFESILKSRGHSN